MFETTKKTKKRKNGKIHCACDDKEKQSLLPTQRFAKRFEESGRMSAAYMAPNKRCWLTCHRASGGAGRVSRVVYLSPFRSSKGGVLPVLRPNVMVNSNQFGIPGGAYEFLRGNLCARGLSQQEPVKIVVFG